MDGHLKGLVIQLLQPRVLRFGFIQDGNVDHAHATAELFDDAVVRHGSPITGAKSYVCETGKSMKAAELVVS